jgi:hypothetical protein
LCTVRENAMPLRASSGMPPATGTSNAGMLAISAPVTPQPSHPTIASVARVVVTRAVTLRRLRSAKAPSAESRLETRSKT